MPRNRLSPFARLGILLGTLATGFAVCAFTGCAERLFYYPTTEAFETPPGIEDMAFESDGRVLHAWFLRAEGAAPGEKRPVIVHCHGNAQNISRHLEFVEFLTASGCHVVLFDYRGYGRSASGPLHREGLIADARAAIDAAAARPDVDPERMGLFGLSLGGTIGLAAAAEDPRIDAVCSVATFSRWPEVAADHAGPIGRWLIKPGRDAVASAAALGHRPLLIIHGTADDIVPHRHAPIIEARAADAGVAVERLSLDGAGHIDWVDRRAAREKMLAFFREHLVDAE